MNTQSMAQLVAEFDAQVALNVRTNGRRWQIETLTAVFEKQGLIQRIDGNWIMPDSDGSALFALSAASPLPNVVSLVTNLPCISPDKNAFGLMAACAREMALQLDGTLVDDRNKPLSELSLAKIAAQVTEFYEHMEKAGLAPGSLLAKNLFSHDNGGKS